MSTLIQSNAQPESDTLPDRDFIRVGPSPDVANGIEPSVYLIHLHHGMVIDGSIDGNDARFINHGCDPNCEIYIFGDRLYAYAMRDITQGEELTFDYALPNSPA